MRITPISKRGKFILEFTNQMEFPENLASLINENSSGKLLEILMINGDSDEIDKNLSSWTVT